MLASKTDGLKTQRGQQHRQDHAQFLEEGLGRIQLRRVKLEIAVLLFIVVLLGRQRDELIDF
jgi:hypothetical protein